MQCFKSIVDFFNPASDNFCFKLLGNLLKDIFIPKEEDITNLKDAFEAKLGFVDTIKNGISGVQDMINGIKPAPKLSIVIPATKYSEPLSVNIIDMSWYTPYKNMGDAVLTGFIYIMFLWRLFIHLPSIIAGTGGAIQADYQVQEINAYNRFGFGRSSNTHINQGGKNK